jgi:hypothetical protein
MKHLVQEEARSLLTSSDNLAAHKRTFFKNNYVLLKGIRQSSSTLIQNPYNANKKTCHL